MIGLHIGTQKAIDKPVSRANYTPSCHAIAWSGWLRDKRASHTVVQGQDAPVRQRPVLGECDTVPRRSTQMAGTVPQCAT
jgi:hypothetical protein